MLKKQVVYLLLAAAPISLLAAGCFKKSEEDAVAAVVTDILTGTWKKDCAGSSGDYSLETHVYSGGNTMVVEGGGYSDSACATQTMKVSAVATYALGSAASAPSGATHFDYTVTSFKVTPMSALVVSDLNANSACGKTDWTINVEKDVSSILDSCTYFKISGGLRYSIVKVDGTKLYDSDETSGCCTTAALRTTSLQSTFYTKQ